MSLRECATIRSLIVANLFVAGLGSAQALSAQAPAGAEGSSTEPPIPRYEVRRATGPINIDGLMNEPAWEAASPPAELHGLWESQTGPRQATRARLLWDDNYLYVGYDVEDIDITAQYTQQDDPVYLDDAVEIFINPRPEQIGLYYGLEMNARTVYYDYLLHEARIFVKQFDMKGLRVATNLRGTLNVRGDADEGWTLEVAIPWSNFEDMARRPTVGTTWKAQLNRWDGVQPDRRMSIWSDPLQERPQPHVPARFGDLLFVE